MANKNFSMMQEAIQGNAKVPTDKAPTNKTSSKSKFTMALLKKKKASSTGY